MDDFINASQQLGKNIVYVQGAGGNISVKLRDILYIKASGYKMKSIQKGFGYVGCRYKGLADYISEKKTYSKKDEEAYLSIISDSIVFSEKHISPSMEVGFHAILPSKYVIHLHSVYVNVFTCMKYGKTYLEGMFKSLPFAFVPYASPGYELAHILSQKKSLPSIIFLKNHGIIIHSESIKACLILLEKIHGTIEAYLKMQNAFAQFQVSGKGKGMKKYVFPDSAVFAAIDYNALPSGKKKEITEIMSAQYFIVDTIKRLKKQPSFLSLAEVKKLTIMKQETHRQKIFQNNK